MIQVDDESYEVTLLDVPEGAEALFLENMMLTVRGRLQGKDYVCTLRLVIATHFRLCTYGSPLEGCPHRWVRSLQRGCRRTGKAHKSHGTAQAVRARSVQ
jgi:hypothetical protein